MRTAALTATLSLAAGIFISAILRAPWWCGILAIAAAIAVWQAIMHASGSPVRALRMGRWHTVWVVMLFAGTGMLDECIQRPLRLEEAFGKNIPSMLKGTVTGIISKTYGDRLEVDIDGTNGARAQIRTGAGALSEGDIIMFPSGRLREIAADSSSTVSRSAGMLESKGILYSAFIPTKLIVATGHRFSFRQLCRAARQDIEIRIERSHIEKRTADFLKAILMGDKDGLDQETRLTFANGGTAHMLALSGLHMGILAGMLMWLMWPARFAGRYKWGYAAAIVLLWGYVFITGMAHSSVRACIMISFAFAGVITERKNASPHALCCACLLIMLADPSSVFDAGFQLSVVCVAALLAFASRLNPVSHRRHPVLFRVCEALLATMVATAASLPLTSYYFGQVPLMFLPTNVLLLPLIPAYLGLGALFTILLCAGFESGMLACILDLGHRFLLSATEGLSAGSDYVLDYQIPLAGLIAWILLLGAGAWILNRKTT